MALIEEAYPGRYVLAWKASNGDGRPLTVRATVDGLRTTRDHDLQAHLAIVLERDGRRAEPLRQGRLNLHALRSRRELARALEERVPLTEPPWELIVEELCDEVVRRERETVQALDLDEVDVGPVSWVARPLVLDGTVTLWYAPGGAGKTYLALWLALLVEGGVGLGEHEVAPRRVVYLDWEADERETARRVRLLRAALARKGVCGLRSPAYVRCVQPLADEVAGISRIVAGQRAGLVVVDSAGVACGGDIQSAESALDFFRGLRRICSATSPPAAALVLHHVTKSERREEHGVRLPLGSVYFENMPRLTWEVRPEEQDDGAGSLVVGLRCRKSNVGRQQPLGVQLDFNDGEVDVRLVDAPADRTPKALTKLAIIDLLKAGPATTAELVEATGLSAGAVSVALNRMKKAGQVVNVGRGVWALTAHGEEA